MLVLPQQATQVYHKTYPSGHVIRWGWSVACKIYPRLTFAGITPTEEVTNIFGVMNNIKKDHAV